MAKNIDIGVNNVARNVKNTYIGVDGKARKIKAGWIGVSGVARQFYVSEQLIPFTSSVVPTSWTAVTTGTDYTASNTYGTWEIKADDVYSTSYPISYAFDTNESTFYRSKAKSNTTSTYINLICPVEIKPETISIKHKFCGSSTNYSYVQASKDNSTWIDLGRLSIYTSETSETLNVSTDNYYKYFRIKLYRYSSSYNTQMVYDFKITSGTLKIE